ncbi:hypothetical protein LOK74_00955 [Brevibacillus humidisoli]|uniref:hypothetical protein n=1 Tax=Brevibacillus humidisoli TaxID=2895522 RepID=UPI001E4EA42D|nr:hypothetical protein [Brevibacillus humidisoli]UFJ41163.1 hypothetical protein LOK74_00955 [Brevibacillus humidisoli]
MVRKGGDPHMSKSDYSSDIAKEELEKLGTHATGSPEQLKTRTTSETRTIQPPEQPGGIATGKAD